MDFIPVDLKVNYTKSEYAVAENHQPVFTWGAKHPEPGRSQLGYHIVVTESEKTLWDSGFVADTRQTAVYQGTPLPSGAHIKWSLEITDNNNQVSALKEAFFTTACLDEWAGRWICSPLEQDREAQYFTKRFELSRIPERAVLYHCGLGLDKAYINGTAVDNCHLTPAFTNYSHSCCYVISILDPSLLKPGTNEIQIVVASGWRKIQQEMPPGRVMEFSGNMLLNAQLALYEENEVRIISTDATWSCAHGYITFADLYDGEVYDAQKGNRLNSCGVECKAEYAEFTGALRPQTVEPVRVKRELRPVASYRNRGKQIFDFGENISGVLHITAKGTCTGPVRFVMRHAEELDEQGELFTEPLREAKAEDIYICGPGSCEIDYSPQFTYHGFRYASLAVEGEFAGSLEVHALYLYTDIDSDGYFKSGNATANAIYDCALRTERDNLHSIAEDCPQRDERMGWMNDATSRFPTMRYHFGIARLFEKIVADIVAEQDKEGRITCTAPFVWGNRPADPVCSSFLLAGREHYRYTGSTALIDKYYHNFVKWNRYLQSRTVEGIVDYSYYGDWAGPADCCAYDGVVVESDTCMPEKTEINAAVSCFIPGTMVSTGCLYWNYRLLEEFAVLLGKEEDRKEWEQQAEATRRAYLKKWFDFGTGRVCNGSQACQAFSLFIGIIPEEHCKIAARQMIQAVEKAGCRLQTGNIATPMLMHMLSEYGREDLAWKLFIREKHPSWGYMLANGATTIWERFELKKDSGMNSHNHPMYGAVTGWLYESLAGFRTLVPNKSYRLAPNAPKELLYFEMRIPLLHDGIYLRYEKKYGMITIFTDIPFGMTVALEVEGRTCLQSSGFHVVNFPVS